MTDVNGLKIDGLKIDGLSTNTCGPSQAARCLVGGLRATRLAFIFRGSACILGIATLALLGPQVSMARALQQRSSGPPQRPFHEISEEMREALRTEATAKSVAARVMAIHALAALYVELMEDPRLGESDTLERYRVKIRARLLKIREELLVRIQRERSHPGSLSPHTHDSSSAAWESMRSTTELLALSEVGFGGAGSLLTYWGPGHGVGAWGGAPWRGDFGPDLAELIRRTISPEFWDVNGGPGTIVYYRQWFALVVRATAEVHHRIGGVLGGNRE